jgi:carbon-monoxide dehydrogenase large subunit
MAVEGIGARALRKEDKRFITGKGRYTDDMTCRAWGMRLLCARRMHMQKSS